MDQDQVSLPTEIDAEAGLADASGCVFRDIISGSQPATVLYEDERVVVVVPSERPARVHVLVVLRKHIPSIDALTVEDRELWCHLLAVAQRMARQEIVVAG